LLYYGRNKKPVSHPYFQAIILHLNNITLGAGGQGKRINKKKTVTEKGTCYPFWEKTVTFAKYRKKRIFITKSVAKQQPTHLDL
jgi:hypothetical protein